MGAGLRKIVGLPTTTSSVVAPSRRQWGSARSLASGAISPRHFDPDTRRMVPAPQTNVLNSIRGLPLMTKRAIGHYANGGPVTGGSTQSRKPHMIEQGLSVSKITESLGVLKRVLDRVVRGSGHRN
jgi:hypothetical protein